MPGEKTGGHRAAGTISGKQKAPGNAGSSVAVIAVAAVASYEHAWPAVALAVDLTK